MENSIKNKIIENLNKEQKAAIIKLQGPIRILAGAGSGKTNVLTKKIAYLIEVAKKEPKKILALTFTNKAANEMRERVELLVGDKVNEMIISTFHSLCARFLILEYGNFYGIKQKFAILDAKDQEDVLKEIYRKWNFTKSAISYSTVLEYISTCKLNSFNSEEQIENANDEIQRAKAICYREYQKLLKKSNSLDFDDLLIETKYILTSDKDVLKKWQSRFEYFLIDEFQDTSKVQYEIISLLAKSNNLTIVGDPDQTIYSWRGADISFINDFDKLHPKTVTVVLHQNYRSTKKILNIANNLIKHNPNRLPKVLDTTNPEGDDIDYYQGNSQESEASWIVSKVNQLKKNKVQLKDIAILYRSNFYSRVIEDAFISENIPHKIIGGFKFYERSEIKDSLSFLRSIWSPNDICLKRIINTPVRKIGTSTLEKLVQFAEEKNLSLWDSWMKHFNEIKIQKEPKENLFKFINIVRKHHAALQKKYPIHAVLDSFLKEINYIMYIKENKDDNSSNSKIDNINELLKSIKNWEEKYPNKTIDEYLDEISLMALSSDEGNNINYVSLMTIHSAKGLEFKNVFVVGLNEEIFPSCKSIEDEKTNDSLKMEEERRLAYVAITRARERLFLSSSKGLIFDSSKPKKPSRFLKEMGIRTSEFVSYNEDAEISQSSKSNKEFKPGDYVIHTSFGEGVVLDINGDTIIIEFKNKDIGTKQLLKNHKSIERL